MYDRVKKARAAAKRYRENKEKISLARKERRIRDKPLMREGAPTIEELRRCIEQGFCWWCGKGGWRRLPQHTSTVHQINASDLREMALFLKRAPPCISEESEAMSERTLRLLAEGKRKLPDPELGRLVKHEYSTAGMAIQRQHAAIARAAITPECRQEIGPKLRKPHPCSVCGKALPRAHPICCSVECRRIATNTGAKSAETRKRLCQLSPEYRERVSQREQHARRAGSHPCPKCGGIVPTSRPKYCLDCGSKRPHGPRQRPFPSWRRHLDSLGNCR